MSLTLSQQRDMTETEMTDYLETEFFFEELNIVVNGRFATGMMLNGTATLTGDDDGFSVSFIELDGGTTLRKCNAGISGMHKFEDELFARIASVIENPKTHIGKLASSAWDDVREDAREAA